MHVPKGIICPLATPLDDEERVDVATLRRLLDRILPEVDAVFVLGSSGEFPMLRETVAQEMVDATLAHVNGRVPVYVGVADAGTGRAIDNLKRVARSGAAAVVATSPFYYPISEQKALVEHFTRIAEASALPLILYNIPQNTGIHLTPESVHRLAEHPNIVGIKDSWGDMILFQEFLRARSERFAVLQGREQLAAVCLWLGCDGLVSTLANFAPRMLRRLVTAVQGGNREEALAAQRAVTDLAQIFNQGYWLVAMKAALAELGLGTGRLAAPLPACTPEQRQRIRALLHSADLL